MEESVRSVLYGAHPILSIAVVDSSLFAARRRSLQTSGWHRHSPPESVIRLRIFYNKYGLFLPLPSPPNCYVRPITLSFSLHHHCLDLVFLRFRITAPAASKTRSPSGTRWFEYPVPSWMNISGHQRFCPLYPNSLPFCYLFS